MEPTAELRRAVKKYREGRGEAFNQLYEESSKYIYTCIYKVMSGNDNVQDSVCDIMQDTYVEISRNIAQLDNENSFLSWAGTIATRKCYAWLKKNKKYVLLHEEDDTFENLADNDNIIPEDIMQDREKQRLVREIIDTQLTEMQKLCIIAFYYNEQKQSEIAQELGIPENTVKTNLSRARAKIKENVLDLEKKQGTRLYSAAPLLLLLFKEDVLACTVPKGITESVLASGPSEAGIGRIIRKITKASIKTKMMVSVAAVGIIGGTVLLWNGKQEMDNAVPEQVQQIQGNETVQNADAIDMDSPKDTAESQDLESGGLQKESGNEITLSEKEQKDIEMLAGMISLNSYFFGDDMYGSHYPVNDISVNMKLIDMIGNMGLTDKSYTEYLPPTETDDSTLIRYCRAEDVQSYLKDVFGIENADISTFCEGDRAVFDTVGDFILVETTIERAAAMPDGTYEIAGIFSIWEATDLLEAAYPYELTAVKNDGSPFGFQLISMGFGEEITEEYGQVEQAAEDGLLSDILLNPEGNSAYFPQGVEYKGLYFALIDIDKDGEDEILLGTPETMDYYGDPIWMTIFNILKYDSNTGEVSDYDGDMVYKPLDANSWHYYDTGLLMTMAEVGNGHTNFWNLITGEFTDTAAVNPDYQSLTSGNEIPIIWCEVNQDNVSAVVAGGNAMPVYTPKPYGRYTASRGAKLEFLNDDTVLVSEGNSTKKCAFTIDGYGNLVIDPDGEAVEGVYDSQADEIRIYELKFRR